MMAIELQWTSTVYSDTGYAGSVHYGPDGYLYITGYSETGGINSDDTIISKYSTSGIQQWTTTTEQVGYDVGREIKTGPDGSSYTVGVFQGNFFGDVASTRDAYLLKYDSTGTFEWSRTVAKGNLEQEGESLCIDNDGYIYVTGTTSENLGEEVNNGGKDIFIEKYSSSGEKQWSKLIGSAGDEGGEAITLDANGDLYITGGTTGELSGETNNGGKDAFLVKLSSSGEQQWVRLLGGSGDEATTAIDTSPEGSIYVTGWSKGDVLDHVNQGDKDVLTAKYSATGELIWTSAIGTSSFERARGINVVSENNIYIAGNFDQDFDGNSGTEYGGAFLTKYASNGEKVSTKVFGIDSYHSGESVTSDNNGALYSTLR